MACWPRSKLFLLNEYLELIEPEADDLMDKVRNILPLGIEPTPGVHLTEKTP